MKRFTVLLAVLALIAMPLVGATVGTIKVTVTDASGAALPGATVEATSPTSIGTRTEVTDSTGVANLSGLNPGRYTVKVSLSGMQTQTLTTSVSADKTTDLSSQLAMGGVAEQITVTAEAPIVETKRATVADEVTLEEVEALPVSRDYRGYAQLVAGVNVVPNQGGREVAVDPSSKGGNNYRDRTAEGRTGGTGSRDNQYYLDGLIITDITSGEGSMSFNNEVILEQQVITSGIPAEFAGGKGFVGNIVTKSGGNDFSGSLNYYMISPEFYSDFKNSDDRLAVNLEDKNDGALTLGGPIWRDRAWFFLSGQMRENSDDVVLSASASPNGGTETYLNERTNYFGKVTAKLTEKTTLIAQY
ncbi:MAG TPA: TonB-dependent receptor, partial [Thermoanaerobaculia bacterium]|nr:TonB-dependent receptor [Thermoanaerobaculia bacterium]